MSFDFFNTSVLAFGQKLTAAFKALNSLANEAEANLKQVYRDREIFSQYTNRNYQIPFPTRADAGCQSNQAYDLVNDSNALLELTYTNSTLTVRYNMFDRTTNKYTIGVGSTTSKSGYAFCKKSISNKDAGRDIEFVSNYQEGQGEFLFRYSIDSRRVINIVKNNDALIQFITGDETGYKSLTKGSNVSLPYTATEPCCLCIYSPKGKVNISKNGKAVYKANLNGCWRHVILYLKKGDKITAGSGHKAFLVNYNR